MGVDPFLTKLKNVNPSYILELFQKGNKYVIAKSIPLIQVHLGGRKCPNPQLIKVFHAQLS